MISIESFNGIYHLVGANGTIFKSPNLEKIKKWIVERRDGLVNGIKKKEAELVTMRSEFGEAIQTLDDVLERNKEWFK